MSICDRPPSDSVFVDLLQTYGCGLQSLADSTVGRVASAAEDVSENVSNPLNLAGLGFGVTAGVVVVGVGAAVVADLVVTKGAGLRAAAVAVGLR